MRLDQKILAVAIFAGSAIAAAAVEVKPTGRLHLDYARYASDVAQFDDRGLVRRAQLGLKGDFGSSWSAEVAYDFALGGTLKDVYLRYRGWGHSEIRLGQFKLPFGMEQLTGPDDITFLERGLPSDAFAPSRRMGIGFQSNRAKYTWAAMGFGSSIEGKGGNGAATRFTFNPIKKGNTLVHLGLAVLTERPDGLVNLGAVPEALPTDIRLVRTGRLADVARRDQLGAEAAWKQGPFSIQSEWMQARLSRSAGAPEAAFNGWYVAGSWVLSGESRDYKNGVFKQLQPAGKAGAWELAMRYSRIRLNSGLIEGGEEHNLTFGLNWYFKDYLRVMADYVMVASERRGIIDNPNILDVRAQVAF